MAWGNDVLARLNSATKNITLRELASPMPWYSRGVAGSPDFQRILALQTWTQETLDSVPIEKLIAPHHATFFGAIGGNPATTLRLNQRNALANAVLANGLFAPLSVGEGKTLITLLLPTVLAKKAVVLCPARLIKGALKEKDTFSRSFKIRDDITHLSYEMFSREDGHEKLEVIQPGLIIADEVQCLKNPTSARYKRLKRYLKEHPGTLFCGLSGTITRKSIKDFAHLLEMALKELSPLPRSYQIVEEWSKALDDPPIYQPGVLAKLPGYDGCPRKAWKSKFLQSVGVVGSTETIVNKALTIKKLQAHLPDVLVEEIKKIEKHWVRPDGEELVTSIDAWRVKKQLRNGGYYRWAEPLPGEEWFKARSEWHRELRTFLKYRSRKGLDSPMLVARNIQQFPELKVFYDEWQRAGALYDQPPTEWCWVDKSYLEQICRFYSNEIEGALVWYDWVEVGKYLEQIVPKSSKVVSIKGDSRGHNFQYDFHKNFVFSVPSSGVDWTQLIGRTYRPGQKKNVEVYYLNSFSQEMTDAVQNSKFQKDITGSTQPLLLAKYE